jgi:uncharacterized damage-inducible protein DinB
MSMPVTAEKAKFELGPALLASYATNERVNQFLLENLDPGAWRAEPPKSKGRNIAGLVAHLHNVRVMWLKSAKAGIIPEQLDRHTIGLEQARAGLDESFQALNTVLAQALETDGRIRGFKPDVVGFVGYLIAHDAHHRGQIAMLARQAGFPLNKKTQFGLWEWGIR